MVLSKDILEKAILQKILSKLEKKINDKKYFEKELYC